MINNKGFTLVEVVITVIIIGILSIIGVYVYGKHLNNAKYSEGMRLAESIKEQQDLSLSFSSSDTVTNPFVLTGGLVINSTFPFNRNQQNLGMFYIYPHHYKYFREFTIREPDAFEIAEYNVVGFGYVLELYYPDEANWQLKIKLIGSSEGAYTFVREEAS